MASILGRHHREIGKNNQDAFYVLEDENLVIGLVADGCGSTVHSEVGSNLAVRIIANLIKKHIYQIKQTNDLLEKVRLDFLVELHILVNQIGTSVSKTINDFFLFTLVGFILDAKELIVFSLGDGVVVVNDDIKKIGPFPQNEPPYLAYALTGSTLENQNEDFLRFQILNRLDFCDFEQVVIGSDGLNDLIFKQGENIPGKKITVPSFLDFIKNKKLFNNTDLLRRKLFLINRDAVMYKRNIDGQITDVLCEKGLLEDDTTLIIARKVSL